MDWLKDDTTFVCARCGGRMDIAKLGLGYATMGQIEYVCSVCKHRRTDYPDGRRVERQDWWLDHMKK